MNPLIEYIEELQGQPHVRYLIDKHYAHEQSNKEAEQMSATNGVASELDLVNLNKNLTIGAVQWLKSREIGEPLSLGTLSKNTNIPTGTFSAWKSLKEVDTNDEGHIVYNKKLYDKIDKWHPVNRKPKPEVNLDDLPLNERIEAIADALSKVVSELKENVVTDDEREDWIELGREEGRKEAKEEFKEKLMGLV